MSRSAKGAGTIRKRSDGRWEARYTLGRDGAGKQIQRSVYGATQKEVREKLQSIEVSITDGVYLEPSRQTVEQWLNIWLQDYCSDIKYSTVKSYKSTVKNHIVPKIGAIRLQELKPAHIQSFLNGLSKTAAAGLQNKSKTEKKALTPKTVKNIYAILNRALNIAVEQELITRNPAAKAKLPKMTRSRNDIVPLTEEQIKSFFEESSKDDLGDILQLIFLLGLRESEALGLTWDAVDFKAGTVTINKQLQRRNLSDGGFTLCQTKNSKSRKLECPEMAMEILRKREKKQMRDRLKAGEFWSGWKNETERKTALCFTKEDGINVNVTVLYNHFKRIAKRIGREDARVHDLRHSYACMELSFGTDIKTIQTNLGHATASFTLDVYGHASGKMQRDSADKMQAFAKTIAG